MKRPWLVLALFLTPLLLLSPSSMAGGEVNFFLGQKQLDLDSDPEFDSIEDQTEFGVHFSYNRDWPLSLAVDVLVASDDAGSSYSYYYYPYGDVSVGVNVDIEVSELNLGVRKYWGQKSFQGYVGGGAALIQADVKLTASISAFGLAESVSESDDDSAFGFWLNGGIVWRLGERLNLGLDVRYSDAEVEVFAEPGASDKFDAGGTHVGAYVGFRWGS